MSESKHAPPMPRTGAVSSAATGGAVPSGRARGAELALPPAYLAPEPHLKYHIPVDRRDPSMDYLWLPSSFMGEPNKKGIAQHYRMGWVPARAGDFPEISGVDAEFPPELIARGLVDNVNPDDVIDIDGLLLMQRPLAVSQMARRRALEEARGKVDNQMQRLKANYRANFDGGGVRRSIRPLADEGYVQQEA